MRLLSPAAAASCIGEDLGTSDWLQVDQAMVDGFAAITGDRQWIHVDPAAAAQTPFGGTIAHGFLTLSLIASLMPPGAIVLEGVTMGLNYGFERVRFLAPVRTGKRIRARHRLIGFAEKGQGRFLVTTEVSIEIEGEDKPALVAEWHGLQQC